MQLEVHICNFHSLYDDFSSMLDEFGLMSLPDVVMSMTISWHHPVGLQRVRSLYLVSLSMMMLPAQRVGSTFGINVTHGIQVGTERKITKFSMCIFYSYTVYKL